ncbi:hypothetical protein [Gemmiger sp. An194]|uniref:hypothetical protein n=1 Tax=Gemmiger sp. An194 TaxID=1965582 RepID=UPI000B39CC9A|nr:hypothetical protein [Gemmiger sp. An194]OUP23278.1 hypothetical protein B5F28_12290 [Gemmiger sp. An194]
MAEQKLLLGNIRGPQGAAGPNTVSSSTTTSGFEDGHVLFNNKGKVGGKKLTASDVGAADAKNAVVRMGLVSNGIAVSELTLGIWETDGSHKVTPWPEGLNDSAVVIRNNNQTIITDIFGTLATYDHYYNVWKFNTGNAICRGGVFPNGQKPDSVGNGYFICNASNKPSPWPDGVNEDATLVRMDRFVQLVDVFGTVKTWNIYSQEWR